MKSKYVGFISVALLLGCFQSAMAAYPDRPIRVIVPFAPGGNVDLTARAIVPGMIEQLKTNVIVDNRAGAGGAVGAEIVVGSAPDGYTLLVGSTGLLTIAPVVYSRLRYDPVKDFEAISLIANVPLVMLVNHSSSAKTVKEFIVAAKARGDSTMASSGNFSTGRLTGELFQSVTGTRFVHVPYKGASLALLDLMGGRVDVMFDQVSSAIGHVRAGKVRALGLTAAKRSIELPDVPTMKEAGVSGVDAGTFTAILAPAKTPKNIIAKLNNVVNQVLGTPALQQNFAKYSADIISTTPVASKAFIKAEIEKWRKVVRSAKLKTD